MNTTLQEEIIQETSIYEGVCSAALVALQVQAPNAPFPSNATSEENSEKTETGVFFCHILFFALIPKGDDIASQPSGCIDPHGTQI